MFTAGYTNYEIDSNNNSFDINVDDEIETSNGWIPVSNLNIGSCYTIDTDIIRIVDLIKKNNIITVVY